MALAALVGLAFAVTFWTAADSSPGANPAGADLGHIGSFPVWSKVEIVLQGPASVGMGNPNPFQMQVDVTFTGPGGQTFVIPAFYDGDGSGGMDGNVWKVRFSPNPPGAWSFESSSSISQLDGYTGLFTVLSNSGCQPKTPDGLPNFACVGRLEYADSHYLQFANGPYWLKGGANEPEDILAPGVTAGQASKEAAIDYLVNRGVNSLYVMLSNVGGDRKNVWPWVGNTQAEAQANHERFNVAKLADWESFFAYAQQNGVVLHIVFEDDSAWSGFNRSMYYREMVSRFGHHNGLFWDISEEYNEQYTFTQVKTFAQMLTDVDAYDHPMTVHNQGSLGHWEPFLGDDRFDLTSFQTSSGPQNPLAVTWFGKVEDSGRTIPTGFDEATRNLLASERSLFRHTVWSVYMGGANTEIYTRFSVGGGYQEYDLQFRDMTRAREFVEASDYLQMRPRNDLVLSGSAYVFAQSGVAYLAYLPSGGTIEFNLGSASGNLSVEWFNPRTGATQNGGSVPGGDVVSLSAPNSNDWGLRMLAGAAPTLTPTSTATATSMPSMTPTASPTPMTTTPTSTAGPPTSTSTPVPPTATDTPGGGGGRATASPSLTLTPTQTLGQGTPSATPSATSTPDSGGGRQTATSDPTSTPTLPPTPSSTPGPGTPSATPVTPTATSASGGGGRATASPSPGPGTPSATPVPTSTPGGRQGTGQAQPFQSASSGPKMVGLHAFPAFAY